MSRHRTQEEDDAAWEYEADRRREWEASEAAKAEAEAEEADREYRRQMREWRNDSGV